MSAFLVFYFSEHRTCATEGGAKSPVRTNPEKPRPSGDEGSKGKVS